MKRFQASLMVLGLALALVAGGCSDSGNDLAGTPAGMGQLTVNVHDATSADISEAWVTFTSVQAIASDGTLHDVGGVTLDEPVNLAELINGNQVTLAQDALPEGSYIGLRVTVSAVDLVFSNGDPPVGLSIPGGGLAFQVMTSFTVSAETDAVVTLDIPLGSFQQVGGNWVFNPGAVTVD